MKKSQRARLAVLAAKDAATLTAEEKAELVQLQALATANPDATKDVDEATPAAAATCNAAPATLASVIRGALSGFGDKAKLGTELAQAKADLATRTTELASANTEITNLKFQMADSAAQLATFATFFGLKPADLAGKSSEDLTKILAQRISDSAVEQLATACVPAAQLPKQAPSAGGNAADTLAEIHAQMQTEKDPEKLGRLAAKANQIRDAKVSGNN